MSGLRAEDSTASGKWRFLTRSTSISHFWVACRWFCPAWLWMVMVLSNGLALAGCFFSFSCSRWAMPTPCHGTTHIARVTTWSCTLAECAPLYIYPHTISTVGPPSPPTAARASKVSYTARRWKNLLKLSSRHSSLHEIVLLGRFHPPSRCIELLTWWSLLPSSSRFWISSWIMDLSSLGVDFGHCHAGSPTPDILLIPASLVSWSWESLYIRDSLHLAALNASTTDDRGSCSSPNLM